MIDVVHERNILAENMLAQTIVETRPFVGNCSGRKIVKKKAEQIEDCSWFQNDGVFSGREFDGVCGAMCFVTGPLGQFVRIKVSNITEIRFGPMSSGSQRGRLHPASIGR